MFFTRPRLFALITFNLRDHHTLLTLTRGQLPYIKPPPIATLVPQAHYQMTPRTGEWRFVCPRENCGKFYTRREFTIRHHMKAHNSHPDPAAIKRVALSDLAVQCMRSETSQFPAYTSNDSMMSVNNDHSPMTHMLNGDYTRYEDSQSSEEGNVALETKLGSIRFMPPASVSTPLSHRKEESSRASPSEPSDLLVRLLHDQNLQISELRNSLNHLKKENKRLYHVLSAVEELVAGLSRTNDSNKRPKLL